MLRRTCLAAATTIALSIAFPAAARDVKVSGMGVRKCSEWQQWKESRNGDARALALEWAQGFISGHNVYARMGSEESGSVVADTKVLVPLFDAYCQKYPDNRLLTAVVEITQSLGGVKINIAPKPPAAPPSQPAKPAPGKGEVES